jgi:hypothetical protein
LGILNTREAYLASGQQQTITVSNMRVPERPDESKIRFTLKVGKKQTIFVFGRALSCLHCRSLRILAP